jgi:arylsulfatase
MTTYEGGVRVISMLRWPGVIKPGQVLNGIQAHMDMFTSLATAAGVRDVAETIKQEKKQYIDGVDNLDYWTGKTPASKRHAFFYYYEGRLMGIRMGQWKFHFTTREHYYDNLSARAAPVVFNLRSDPFESYDSKDSFGHLGQKVSWLFQPMSLLLGAHLKTLSEYPPVQGGTSFDMSNVVEDFLQRARQ